MISKSEEEVSDRATWRRMSSYMMRKKNVKCNWMRYSSAHGESL